VKWRLMLVPPRSGSENMARDTGLMDRARTTGEAVFSVYSWARPTLSFGRNQTATGKYDLGEVERCGVDVVRRPTGGRALLHHREITYSVTAPVTGESLNDSYERINALLLHGLESLGVKASVATSTSAPIRPGDIPCFAIPSKGELVNSGRKLVGSAQVREDGALLQHGSILVEDDQSLIAALSFTAPKQDAAAAATLAQALGRQPSVDEVAHALFDAVRSREDSNAEPLNESDVKELTSKHVERYASEWWTWRR
jgi:lipoate-protein ligase A